jgi:cleavage and polyadenylation specificity factor subunit 2
MFATIPVMSLGRTLLQDLYTSTPLAATVIPSSDLSEASYSYPESFTNRQDPNILLQSPTSEEIAAYFQLVIPLKYSQPHAPVAPPLFPPLNGLIITAYNAGHTLGGTIWHIQMGLESVVYAVDWNHGRENILAGAAWLGGAGAGGAEVIESLRKPTALICSSRGGERVALPGGRVKRDELLLNMIKSAASKGGIVLIPTDSSARVLELAYLLEHAWRKENTDDDSPLRTTKLYLASKNIGATMRYTRSMIEWMDDSIVREFETHTGSQPKKSGDQDGAGPLPFDFKHLRLLERRGQIDRVLNETDNLGRSVGKVIIASDTSLEWGFSRDVLRKIADDSRNLVILTERLVKPENGEVKAGLARTLWSWLEERKNGVISETSKTGEVLEQVPTGGRTVEISDAKRVALEGNDLNVYQQWLATKHQLQTTAQLGGSTSLEISADIVDDASSDSSLDSDGSDTEQQGKALNISATMGQANRKKIGLSDEDLGINILIRRKGVYDYDVRGKKGREKMFPMAIRRKRNDDFGEVIRAEDFLREEERDEVDGQDIRQQPGKYDTKDTLGKKRKWDDVTAPGERRLSNGGNKRQQIDRDSRGSPDLADMLGGVEDDPSDDEVEEEVSGPSRLEYTKESLSINVRLAFVDFAGLHDKRSLHMLIPLIQPRKLILVGGMKDETISLANDCRTLLAARFADDSAIDVYTPEIGTIVDASVDTHAWAVKLTDALVKRLTWQNVKGISIATLTARLEAEPQDIEDHEAETTNKRQKLLADDTEEGSKAIVAKDAQLTEIPILDVLPASMVSATRSVAQPLQVGDLRLADLRKIMQTSGHTSEFRGEGTLLIDGTVTVRKTGTGKIEVESIESTMGSGLQRYNTFYAVRSKIYEGLAVVK